MGTNITTPAPFHLWTQSYGGHWGPTFYRYFMAENDKIRNGSQPGVALDMQSLGIVSGYIDAAVQTPYYARYAANNTYGIKTVDDSVLGEMNSALPNCLELVRACRDAVRDSPAGKEICASGTVACRDNVELLWDYASAFNPYDIRKPYKDWQFSLAYAEYLNQAEIQQAMGVNLNYTYFSPDVAQAFNVSGDAIYPDSIRDLEFLLDQNVRVALVYGDADYRCNWFGGEAVSLAVNYTQSSGFRTAGYAPFVIDGRDFGTVRQHRNFSFLNMYEAGHTVIMFQPKASLEMFKRVSGMVDLATGQQSLVGGGNSTVGNFSTSGNATVTRRGSFTSFATTSMPTTTTTATTTESEEPMTTAANETFVQR